MDLSTECQEQIYAKIADKINEMEIDDFPTFITTSILIELNWEDNQSIRQQFYPRLIYFMNLMNSPEVFACVISSIGLFGNVKRAYDQSNAINFQDLQKWIEMWVPRLDIHYLSLLIGG